MNITLRSLITLNFKSQRNFARKIGYHPATISAIVNEHRKPGRKLTRLIGRAFNLNPADLCLLLKLGPEDF